MIKDILQRAINTIQTVFTFHKTNK